MTGSVDSLASDFEFRDTWTSKSQAGSLCHFGFGLVGLWLIDSYGVEGRARRHRKTDGFCCFGTIRSITATNYTPLP